jgi:hypothetical protein
VQYRVTCVRITKRSVTNTLTVRFGVWGPSVMSMTIVTQKYMKIAV